MLSVGDTLPDITLKAYLPDKDDFEDVTLADYRGTWLVLVFYPADFTFVCPTELEDAAKLHADFKKQNAEVMSVSTDTAYVHKAWHDNSDAIKKIAYPMLADPTGTLCRELGTYLEDEGLSLRATFIIGPDGIIKSVEMNDNGIGRNIAETLRKLQAAKFVAEHKGKVCPASWQPGGDTLTPGADLVGKI